MRTLPNYSALIVLASLAGLTACASAPPRPADRPDLVIPAPPPHVVPINSEPIVEPVSDIPGGTPPASGASATRSSGRGTREAAPRPQPAGENKTEAKPETPVVEAPPATPPPPTAPPPQLRTAESPGPEGAIRAQVDRARRLLQNIDYRRLTKERQKAYDDARRFADQAEDALKQGNVVFAQGVAWKAETLARELSPREPRGAVITSGSCSERHRSRFLITKIGRVKEPCAKL